MKHCAEESLPFVLMLLLLLPLAAAWPLATATHPPATLLGPLRLLGSLLLEAEKINSEIFLGATMPGITSKKGFSKVS